MLNFNKSLDELTTLTIDELRFLASDYQAMESLIIESKGYVLSVLDNFKIPYQLLDIIKLNNNTDVVKYTMPYFDKINYQLSKEDDLLMKDLMIKVKMETINKTIRNEFDLLTYESVFKYIDLLETSNEDKNAKILKIVSNVKIKNSFFESFGILDLWTSVQDIEKRKVMSLIWSNSTDELKNQALENKADFWVLANIMSKTPLKDEDIPKFIDKFKNCSFNSSVVLNGVDYIHDLKISEEEKLELLDSLFYDIKKERQSEEKLFKILSKSKYREQLKDINFFFKVRVDIFNEYRKEKSLTRLLPENANQNIDSFKLYVKSMNERSLQRLLSPWTKIISSMDEFKSVINDDSLDVILDYVKSNQGYKSSGEDFSGRFGELNSLYYQAYSWVLDLMIEKATKEIKSGAMDEKLFQKYQFIFIEYLNMVGQSSSNYWSQEFIQECEDKIKKIHNVYAEFELSSEVDIQSQIIYEDDIYYSMFLASFMEHTSSRKNTSHYLNILLKNEDVENLEELYNSVKTVNNKYLFSHLFNNFKKIDKVSIDDVVLPYLKKLGENINVAEYDTKFKMFFNYGFRNDSEFLNKMIDMEIRTSPEILILLIEKIHKKTINRIDKVSPLRFVVLDYIKILDRVSPEIITDDVVVLLDSMQDSVGGTIDLNEYVDNYEIRLNKAQKSFVDGSVKVSLVSAQYERDLMKKLLDEGKYNECLKLRNIYCSGLFTTEDPLPDMINDEIKIDVLSDLIMDDDRFKQFLEVIPDETTYQDRMLESYKLDPCTENGEALLRWITNFFKRYPQLQKEIPLEYKIFEIKNINSSELKKYTIENYPHLYLANSGSMFEISKLTPKEFSKVIKKNKDYPDKRDFNRAIRSYFDVVYDINKVSMVLKEFNEPKEYALMVSMLNQSLMSKTKFYSEMIDVEKFFDGVKEIVQSSPVKKKDLARSFSTVISLSDENKEKIIHGFSELGVPVGTLFYEDTSFIKGLSDEKLINLLKGWINGNKSNCDIVGEVFARNLIVDDVVYVIENIKKQYNSFCEYLLNADGEKGFANSIKFNILQNVFEDLIFVKNDEEMFFNLFKQNENKLTEIMLELTIPEKSESQSSNKMRKF